MANSMYVPMTAAVAAERRLDVVANDLANVDTPGYKRIRAAFRTHMVRTYDGAAATKGLVALDETRADMSAGPLVETGHALDVALPPRHFLVVETPTGPALTRNGHLQVRQDGILADPGGNPLRASPPGRPFVPVRVDPSQGDVRLGEDGRVFQGGTEVASLSIVTAERITHRGDGLYEGAAVQAVATTGLRPGFLEGSNVQPVRGMVRLIEASRAFELQQRVLRQFREIDATSQRIAE